MIAMKNILVATDFGEAADSALTYGRELAQRFDATLHVLHVAENVRVVCTGSAARHRAKRTQEIARSRHGQRRQWTADDSGGDDVEFTGIRHHRLRA